MPLIEARLTSCSNLTYFVVMNPSESDPRHLSIFNYPILIILKCLGSLSDGFMTTKYVKFEQDVNLASIRGTITWRNFAFGPLVLHQVNQIWCSKKPQPAFYMFWRVCNVFMESFHGFRGPKWAKKSIGPFCILTLYSKTRGRYWHPLTSTFFDFLCIFPIN